MLRLFAYFRHSLDTIWTHSRHTLDTLWTHFGHTLGTVLAYSGHTQIALKNQSENTQRTLTSVAERTHIPRRSILSDHSMNDGCTNQTDVARDVTMCVFALPKIKYC